MTGLRGVLVVACLALLGCETDPARSVKIVARPIPAAEPGGGWGAEYQWRPELCPPPPEPPGGRSTLVATGACAFRQEGAMECTSTSDDFIGQMTRPAAGEAKLLIYVNVEKYHGPDSYDGAEMLVGVQDGEQNFRWFGDALHVTVGPGEKFVELASARLQALPPGDETEITVAGTLWCRPGARGTSTAAAGELGGR